MKDTQWHTFSVRMPITLRQKLGELAKAQDRTSADTVRRMIKLAWAELEHNQVTQQNESTADDSPTPLGLFTQRETLTTAEMARALGLAPRTVRDLIAGWLEEGWIEIADPARRSRRYRLTAEYRRIIGGDYVTTS